MKWTNKECKHLLDSIAESEPYQIPDFLAISADINAYHRAGKPGFPALRTPDAVRRKVFRLRKASTSQPDSSTPLPAPQEPKTSFDASWENIVKITKEFSPASTYVDVGLTASKAKKIISFSDLHIPFFLWRNIYDALDEHHDADIVVLNGDILDAYLFSTFSKTKKIAALKEYIVAFDLVNYLRQTFPNVVIVSGNHDVRTSRAAYGTGLDQDAVQIFRPDLLARIANGERLDEKAQLVEKLDFFNVHYKTIDSWFFQIGKTIFCHPSGFGSAYPGATVVKLLDHFNNRYEKQDFDSIVVGHTHKVYKGVVGTKLLIEQGAMAHRLPYQFKADLRFKNASNGYAIIYQDENGNTNFNDSTPIYIGTHLPTKKDTSL